MSGEIYAMELEGGLRISGDPEGADRIREERVPHYTRCPFARTTRGIFDHGYDTPDFVGCTHPVFGQQNGGECFGQCVLTGQSYGRD